MESDFDKKHSRTGRTAGRNLRCPEGLTEVMTSSVVSLRALPQADGVLIHH